MNSMIISVVSIDGNGNGDGLIKVPMMGNVKLGLKLEGIKVAEGGCIVEGKANLSGVSLSVLNDKQREEMKKAYDTFRLVTQTAKQYTPEIATALNKAIAVVDAIGDLSQKISEKKRNTKALLEHFAIAQEPTLIQNCKEIADESKALQDSLEKTIELVKSGKIKVKLADLQAACVKNVAFMNKLAPALAQCQGLSEPNLRDPKSCGPCADPWDMMPTNIVFVCNEAMNKVFDMGNDELVSNDVYKYKYGNFDASDGDLIRTPIEGIKGDDEDEASARSSFIRWFKFGSSFLFTQGELTDDEDILLDHFLDGDGSNIFFSESSAMSKIIKGNDAFRIFGYKFGEDILNYFSKNKSLKGFDGNDALYRTKPNYLGGVINGNVFSWTVMGGFQYVLVKITKIKDKYVEYTLYIGDIFGAGKGDANSTLPGLSEMYNLQHNYGKGRKYNPFRWMVQFQMAHTQ